MWDDAPTSYLFPLGSRAEQRYTLQTLNGGDKASAGRAAAELLLLLLHLSCDKPSPLCLLMLQVYSSPYVGHRLLEFGTSATVALVQARLPSRRQPSNTRSCPAPSCRP